MACLTAKRWNFRSAGSDPVPKPHSNWESHELTSSHLLITSSGWSFLFFLYILRFFLSLDLTYLLLTFRSVFLQPYASEHTTLCCTRAAVCSPAPSKKPSFANRHCIMVGHDLFSGRALSTPENPYSSPVGTLSVFLSHLSRSALFASTSPPSLIPHPLFLSLSVPAYLLLHWEDS